ncbi:MAG: hypothetical protein K0R54_2237 [Clostridiaceae bacterium]|jgi:hypothetical protein|nr:hypothetical protein [Clostridiaceae bacterium]
MKIRVIRSFVDKYSMKSKPKGTEFEVTEERFSELTAGPRGIFVEEIKVETPVDPPKEPSENQVPSADVNPAEPPKELEPPKEEVMEINFDNMTKKELVEYAKEKSIELNMEMTKKEMIEVLLKK